MIYRRVQTDRQRNFPQVPVLEGGFVCSVHFFFGHTRGTLYTFQHWFTCFARGIFKSGEHSADVKGLFLQVMGLGKREKTYVSPYKTG